jgi:hypothetical protein
MFEGESDRYRRGNERSNIQKTNMSTERQKELKRKAGLFEILSILHHRQHAALGCKCGKTATKVEKSGGETATSFACHFVNSMTEERLSDQPSFLARLARQEYRKLSGAIHPRAQYIRQSIQNGHLLNWCFFRLNA